MHQGKAVGVVGSLLLACGVLVVAGLMSSRSVSVSVPQPDQARHFGEGITLTPMSSGTTWEQEDALCATCPAQPCTVNRGPGVVVYCVDGQARAMCYGSAITLAPGIDGVMMPICHDGGAIVLAPAPDGVVMAPNWRHYGLYPPQEEAK